MAITKQADGTWRARAFWRDPLTGEKQQPSKGGFHTKAAAKKWEQDQIAKGRGITHAPSAGGVTLDQLHNEYMVRLERRDASPNTIQYYTASSTHYLDEMGAVRLTDITPLMVQHLLDDLSESGLRSATVRGIHRALRAEFNYAIKLGELVANPCRGLDLPKEQPHEAVIYTPEQLSALLTALADQNHPLYVPVLLCAMNALRRGEAAGLRWQDLDLDAGVAYIRANLSPGKGGGFLKIVKTKSSEAAVALAPDVVAVLAEVKRARIAAGTYAEGAALVSGLTPLDQLDPREFVSLNEAGDVFRPGGLDARLHTFQRAHGLLESGWHDLRHTFGTLLAEAGEDVVTISKGMRHSNTAITAEQYIAGTTKLRRRATNAMAALLHGAGQG